MDANSGDPEDTTLQRSEAGRTRMASPVITKAVQVGNGRYRPLIMVLNAPDVWEGSELVLRGENESYTIDKRHVDLPNSDRRLIKPLNQFGAKPIRKALLEYAAQQWQSKIEVVR